MAAYQKYTAAVEHMVEAGNMGTVAWKIAVSATLNLADTAFVAGTTDLATGGGYIAGGLAAATITSAQTAGTYKLVLADPALWTASGGGFTFRYVILYDSTNGVPYAAWDYGSALVMNGTNGDTFLADLDQVAGVFTVI
jgi:hypothetical protein